MALLGAKRYIKRNGRLPKDVCIDTGRDTACQGAGTTLLTGAAALGSFVAKYPVGVPTSLTFALLSFVFGAWNAYNIITSNTGNPELDRGRQAAEAQAAEAQARAAEAQAQAAEAQAQAAEAQAQAAEAQAQALAQQVAQQVEQLPGMLENPQQTANNPNPNTIGNPEERDAGPESGASSSGLPSDARPSGSGGPSDAEPSGSRKPPATVFGQPFNPATRDRPSASSSRQK